MKLSNVKAKKYRTHLGICFCTECGDIIISQGGGRFVQCKCGKSYVDQERFEGRYVRCGGAAEFIEQICPPTCNIKEHE